MLLKAYQDSSEKSIGVELIDVYVKGLTQGISKDLELLIIYKIVKVSGKAVEKFSKYRYCRFVN